MIIVTGGAGFIGSNLVLALNKKYKPDLIVEEFEKYEKKLDNLSNMHTLVVLIKMNFIKNLKSNPLNTNQ